MKHKLWTGAITLSRSTGDSSFGLVAASSSLDHPGTVRIDLSGDIVGVGEDGTVSVVLSEEYARELEIALTRTLERIIQLRALHHLGMLSEQAYTSGSVEEDRPLGR